jgi:hypothetical protein
MLSNRSIAVAVVLMTLTLQSFDGLAKGTFRFEDRYNPEHIESLPLEIRQAVASKCPEPRALHDFAKYREGTAQIVLHYEHLLCGLSHIYCTQAGCLHQLYGRSAQGHYKLLRSGYVTQPDDERF